MPRTPKGKKRRSSVKNIPRKRLKFDKSRAAVAETCDQNGGSNETEEPKRHIDQILEENASKNNLSTINVKSIIHHVVSDKRVLALVQNVIDEGEGTSEATACTSKDNSPPPPVAALDFEPKMTRSKLKQTSHGDPIAALMSNSPLKEQHKRSPFKKFHFTDLEFPDSSSDEEYNPMLEEKVSDDDTESFVSQESVASPKVLDTPEPKKCKDETKTSDGIDSHSQPVTRSVQKKVGQKLTFKVPHSLVDEMATINKECVEVVEVGEIARRTRSQLPLKDTTLESLEASFQPPDLTPDLYDVLPVEEMDYDDIEWQRWLQGLVCGTTTEGQTEEDNDDTEYNFMAEDQKEEMEEYRNDRAVRIPQKEVTQLIEELLGDYEADDEDQAEGGLFDRSTWSAPLVAPVFMPWQRKQLTEQLQQHTQLLAQLYLMCREEPTLQSEAENCRKYVTELDGFSDRASNANLIRALGDGHVESSAFCFPGLNEAVKIVNSEFTVKKLNCTLRKTSKDSKVHTKKRHNKKSPETFLPPLSQTNHEIMATSSVFKYIELLPHYTLLSKTAIEENLRVGPRTAFTEAEDNLLALGMVQFSRDFKLIHAHLLPSKSPKQLQIRCKNLSASRAPENVIKHYRDTKELWPMPREISNSLPSETRRQVLRGASVSPPSWLTEYKAKHKPRPPPRGLPVLTNEEQVLHPIIGLKHILPTYEKPREVLAIESNADNTTKEEAKRTNGVEEVGDKGVALTLLQQKPSSPHPVDNGVALTSLQQKPSSSPLTLLQQKPSSPHPGEKGVALTLLQQKPSSPHPVDNGVALTSLQQKSSSSPLTLLQQKPSSPRPEAVASEDTELKDKENFSNSCDSSSPRMTEITERKAEDTESTSEPCADADVHVEVGVSHSEEPPEVIHTSEGVIPDQEKEATTESAKTNSGETEQHENTDEKAVAKPGSDVTPCDQSSANSKSNSVAALKGKSRDKSADKSSGRVASRAQGTPADTVGGGVVKKSAVASQSAPVNYVLEPDPKAKERATAFAENYMARVKKQLKSNPDLLEEFLQTLVLSSSEGWSQVELYKVISVVLADYADLVEDFVAFLDPDQAIEAGVFMTNLEFSRAKMFLRKLEVHFHRSPAHFRRIVRVFNSHNKGEKSPLELHQNILPMLRGQQHLIDEFNSFFDDLPPPRCSDEDFEEVELGSGSEPESDDFEEVVIPDLCEPKKVKGRPSKPAVQTPVVKTTSSKAKQPRKAVLPGKTSGPKNGRSQGTGERGTPEARTKPSRTRCTQNNEKKESSGDTAKEAGYSNAKGSEKSPGQTFPKEVQLLSQAEKSQDAFGEDVSSDSEAPHSVRLMLEDPLSALQTETSNDSCRTDDSSPGPTRQAGPLCSTSGRLGKLQDSGPEDDEADLDDVDSVSTNNDVTGDVESDTDTSVNLRSVVLANNVQLGRDGRPAVVWTREHDGVILRTCQENGATADNFERIATQLGDKTSLQVQQRFTELVKLFSASTAASEVKDSTHEDSSSEEDTQGSESESEPCSDQ